MRVLRSKVSACGALLLCAMLAGCHHQQKVPPLSPQARTPDIYVAPPSPDKLPPMASAPPPVISDTKPAVAEEVKPKKKTKKTPTVNATNTPPPAALTATPEPPPAETAKLGALAPEGGANPQQQQEVAGKIAAVEKRVNDLPAAVVDKEQKQIAKVRLFLKEASDALKGGDVEGAKILATKADLLVDDVSKE